MKTFTQMAFKLWQRAVLNQRFYITLYSGKNNNFTQVISQLSFFVNAGFHSGNFYKLDKDASFTKFVKNTNAI